MNRNAQIQAIAAECGFTENGWIEVSRLQFVPEVRRFCEGNACRGYSASWACPPAVGTIEECRQRVQPYGEMLLFSRKYDLEDSFDFDGMADGMRDFKQKTDAFHRKLKAFLTDFLLLSNEGCGRCDECTYPDAPCRFPEMLHHSLEGYGFIVSDLAVQAGIRYHHGPNTVTYFGALFFHEEG